jgi:hypothetical protein
MPNISMRQILWRAARTPEQLEDHRARRRIQYHLNGGDKREQREQSDSRRESSRRSQAKLRMSVIEKLGGKCISCGFSDSRALQVDHKYGGGTADRKCTSWSKRYRDILAGDPTCQLLCANCNWIKRDEHGELDRV